MLDVRHSYDYYRGVVNKKGARYMKTKILDKDFEPLFKFEDKAGKKPAIKVSKKKADNLVREIDRMSTINILKHLGWRAVKFYKRNEKTILYSLLVVVTLIAVLTNF